MARTIALLTDFGTTDIYVSVMKGVMHGISPDIQIIDISHSIEPQNIKQAAFSLLNAYQYFPVGTIFVVVVDPGVGSQRRAVAVQSGGYVFVAPDNGVLSYVLADLHDDMQAVELNNSAYHLAVVSRTFHGRDVFAPVAAHMAVGVRLDELGDRVEKLVEFAGLPMTIEGSLARGEVAHIDQFGNVVTTIGYLDWVGNNDVRLSPRFGEWVPVRIAADDLVVTANGQFVTGLHRTYSDVQPGALLATIGSGGFLELSVNQGHCAHHLDVHMGDRIEMVFKGGTYAAIRD